MKSALAGQEEALIIFFQYAIPDMGDWLCLSPPGRLVSSGMGWLVTQSVAAAMENCGPSNGIEETPCIVEEASTREKHSVKTLTMLKAQ